MFLETAITNRPSEVWSSRTARMPKVISYTPSWLSRPSPGFCLFSSSQDVSRSPRANGKSSTLSVNGSKSEDDYLGPKRTIARRGTEIFVVVGNQIRWSDLCMLKDDWEEAQELRKSKSKSKKAESSNGHREDDHAESSYRVGIMLHVIHPIG